MNSRINIPFDARRFRLYIWIGVVYMVPWLLGDLVDNRATFPERVLNNIWRAIYIVAVNYVFFEYTLRQLSRKRILRSLFLLAAQFGLYSFGLYAWRTLGILTHLYISLRTDKSLLDGVCYHFPYSVASVFFFGVLLHIYDYRQLRLTARQLRFEKQEAELNFLKSQTNPHFLFNTLNNIYSLAQDKSDLAPESIIRLSKILRFMLYEAGGDYIPVEQEIRVIGDYIALEKLRYDESLRVDFLYEVEDMKQPLPPLLLIPLVENAFKHGVSETRHQPFVNIHLTAKGRLLTFLVKNSSEKASEEGNIRENIGLSNLRRQLELLYTDYDLSVRQGGSEFTASLKINLASHV